MKKCQGCTAPIADEAMFCPICGKKQEIHRPVEVMNRFCTKCGNPVAPNTDVCGKCGTRILVAQTRENFRRMVPEVVKQLSVRIVISAVMWICVAAMQLLCAALMVFCFVFDEQSISYLWAFVLYGALGSWNLFDAIKDLEYTGTIKKNFVGIIHHYRITPSVIGLCIYNLYVVWSMLTSGYWFTVLMGLITLSAVIAEFLSIRIFLYTKKNAFIQLEQSQIQQ